MIDLHLHSHFSDGSLTPTELVEEADRIGLYAVALTDHDTLRGAGEFLAAARDLHINAVAGVEISTEYSTGSIHLLGYGVNIHHAQLLTMLDWVKHSRRERNLDLFQRLNQLGYHLTWPDVTRCAGDGVMGRPHFAEALVQRGYVPDERTAFKKILARGRAGYVPRRCVDVADGIRIIHEAGGAAILAHPCVLPLKKNMFAYAVEELIEMGLDGIEVHYSEHTSKETRFYAKLADQYNLLQTGGSDYHGARSPDIRVGRGFGSLQVPDILFDLLTEHTGNHESAVHITS